MSLTFFAVVNALATLVPIVVQAVGAAEAFLGPKTGAEKLQHATRIVEGAIPQVKELAQNVDAAKAAIGPMIEAVVAAANADRPAKPAKRKSPRRKK